MFMSLHNLITNKQSK